MYDELVKRLREADEKSMCGECGLNLHTGATKKGVLFAEAADAIAELRRAQEQWIEQERTALLKSIPRWVPVTERLPDAGERVLCYCRANIYEVMKMRTDGDWVYDTNHIYMHSFVTHWMPLPEPPKEET